MENNKIKDWKVIDVDGVTSFDAGKIIPLLASNKLAAVRIANFYSKNELDSIVQNIKKQGILWYPNFEFKQGRIGICATEYHSKINGKLAYFTLEPENSKIRNEIFTGILEPVNRMINIFSNSYKTSVAKEPNIENAQYFTGLIRAMQHESTTHFDYAPHQLPGWWIAGSETQFAVVVYLQLPESGGGLTIYERQWKAGDDIYNKDAHEKGPKGFEDTFLKDLNLVKIYPKEGDMIIFNSRHFHKVEGIDSERIRLSINSFMSLRDGELYFWN
ncbi:MAG: 2OG-Fe(II) oxygenase [bacterium]|nr:2OG-Fe(II) oxygenase [bacterium]